MANAKPLLASKPEATLRDYNKITNTRKAADGSAIVSGMLPETISTKNTYVSDEFSVSGRTHTLGTILDGSNLMPPIKFASGAGMYSATVAGVPQIIFVSGSNTMATISGAGLSVPSLSSPSGTIDFSGVAITGVSSIAMKSGSYSVDGDPVSTTGNIPATILSIPVAVPMDANACAWHASVRILYTISETGGVANGARTFMFRASMARGTTVPTISKQYNIAINGDVATTNISARLIASAGYIDVQGIGLDDNKPIIWQASASVLRATTQ